MAVGDFTYGVDWSAFEYKQPVYLHWDWVNWCPKKKESEVFYIVAYLDPSRTETVMSSKRFTSEADAQKAAEDQAMANKRDYFVLKTITKLEPPKVKVTRL